MEWWKHALIYQVYPRSFQDSNHDGIGDLEGIRQRLPYLKDLGVDAIWLSPFFKSPMKDFGYDVSDYCDVDPMFGTLEDFDRLLDETHRLGLRLLIDLVPNHTSDQHPWFIESRSSRQHPKRDWYIWQDPKPDGSPPNNWMSYFGGPSWTLDQQTGQYYLHQFLPEQPDLNWRNPEVRQAIYDAMRFWLKRGVDGFRVDVIWLLVEDAQFRDEPPNPHWKEGEFDRGRHLHIYQEDQPETLEAVMEMRQVLDEFSTPGQERPMVGEIYLPYSQLMPYYGTAERPGCHLPFNFHLIFRGLGNWNAANIRSIIQEYEQSLPPWGSPNWVLGNHDQHRVATRIGPEQAKVAAMLLLTLRGTPTWYYGDELAMEDGPIPLNKIQDPAALRQMNVQGEHGLSPGRDPERTPMQWDHSPNAGFSRAEPWLPVNPDYPQRNVAAQQADPHSMLNFVKQLAQLRREAGFLGDFQTLPSAEPVLAYSRGGQFAIFLNLSDQPVNVALPLGELALSTHPTRHDLNPMLQANEGIIVRL